jgi:HSP20 family protein
MTALVRRARLGLPELLLPDWPFEALESWSEGARMLRIEEFMDGQTLVVRAELPGMDPDKDVEITVADGVLTIAAERREESTEGEAGKVGYRSEFRYGSFRRSVALPAGVTVEEIKASYDKGVLEVRVPAMTQAPTPQKIPVSTA